MEQKLIDKRKQLNISQEEMAIALGTNNMTIEVLEEGTLRNDRAMLTAGYELVLAKVELVMLRSAARRVLVAYPPIVDGREINEWFELQKLAAPWREDNDK